MAIIIPANSAADTGYSIDNSCRFNTGDSPYMYKTVVAPTSATISTVSFWMKAIGVTDKGIFSARTDINNRHSIYWEGAGGAKLELWGKRSGSTSVEMHLTRAFRDPSAWIHNVIAIDTTQGTAGNRVKWYVNGVQQTVFTTETQVTEDSSLEWSVADATLAVGAYAATSGYSSYFDGYLAEFVFIDGTQYAASDFGEFDEDSPTIWKPKDVSGLTFGNNGFYLDFEDSSNLGNDANGGTDLTESNLAAIDQATDTPTNNFCTMNPLYAATSSAFTFSQGNCEVEQNASDWRTAAGTIGVSSGKWYFEAKGGQGTNGYTHLGWASDSWLTEKGVGSMYEPTTNHNGPAVTYYGANGNNYYSTSSATGSNASYGATWDNGDTIGCFLDLDNNKAYWSKDGTLQNSGTGYSIESGYTWFPVVGGFDMDNGGESVKVNFGGCPATTISSGNTDGSYGNFEYTTTITGDSVSKTFKALCTKNLAEYG